MTRSLLLSPLLLLLAGPALAQSSGTDPPEEPQAVTPLPCLPPALCLPGQLVTEPLQALTPADAREALLAVRLLGDLEADLQASDDARAELQLQLTRCRGDVAAGVGCPVATVVRPPPADWTARALWGVGGVVVGIVGGVVLALSLSAG